MIHKTALHIAVEKGNAEIVKILLSNEELDINTMYILITNIYKIETKYFNYVHC